jgi:hypothetical protein
VAVPAVMFSCRAMSVSIGGSFVNGGGSAGLIGDLFGSGFCQGSRLSFRVDRMAVAIVSGSAVPVISRHTV